MQEGAAQLGQLWFSPTLLCAYLLLGIIAECTPAARKLCGPACILVQAMRRRSQPSHEQQLCHGELLETTQECKTADPELLSRAVLVRQLVLTKCAKAEAVVAPMKPACSLCQQQPSVTGANHWR